MAIVETAQKIQTLATQLDTSQKKYDSLLAEIRKYEQEVNTLKGQMNDLKQQLDDEINKVSGNPKSMSVV